MVKIVVIKGRSNETDSNYVQVASKKSEQAANDAKACAALGGSF
jgi:hypothetical protein